MAVGVLALAIAAAATAFSAAHAVLLAPLPYDDAGSIVALFQQEATGGAPADGISAANALDLVERSPSLSEVAIAEPASFDLWDGDRARSLRGWLVSDDFFEIARSSPHRGRLLAPDDYHGAPTAMVLSYAAWRDLFGAREDIVGSAVVLDGLAREVVGVLPSTFRLPVSSDVWLPRPPRTTDSLQRSADYMRGFGRLVPESDLDTLRTELTGIGLELAVLHPDSNAAVTFLARDLRADLAGDVAGPLLVVGLAAGALLILACANFAALIATAAIEDRHALCVRCALGADRRQVAFVLMSRSLGLALLATAVGIVLAAAAVHPVGRWLLVRSAVATDLALQPGVIVAVVLIAVACALGAGALALTRLQLSRLRDVLATAPTHLTQGRSEVAFRRGLALAETMVAVAMLVVTATLVRSLFAIQDRPLGYEPDGRIAIQVFARDTVVGRDARRLEFVTSVVERLEGLPGVVAVGVTTNLPAAADDQVASIDTVSGYRIEDTTQPTQRVPRAWISTVSVGYFRALGVRIVSGRDFSVRDDRTAPPVVLVNETLARLAPGGPLTVGSKLRVETGTEAPVPREVIGIVADILPRGHLSEARPEIYLPLRQHDTGYLTFVVHTSGDPVAVAGPGREAVWAANPEQSVWGSATLPDLVAAWVVEWGIVATVAACFGLVSMVLALATILGQVHLLVRQRTSEIAVRRALGGGPVVIARLVLRDAVALGIWASLLGAGCGLLATRALRSAMPDLTTVDPVAIVVGALLVPLLAVAAGASATRGALRIEPRAALRG